MKGLILCAGRSTRLYPITLTFPKALIPVANIPLLQSGIEKLLEQGISDIGIVIHPSQQKHMLEVIGRGERWGITVTYIYQNEAKGIADALKQAESFVGEDSFIVLLGDNLISEKLTQLRLDIEMRGSEGSLLLAEVAKPQDYGIANVKDDQIIDLVEKPRNPTSNLAVLGAYAFKSSIFSAVKAIAPSARGEYEITDAIQYLITEQRRVTYHVTTKKNTDVGTIERWLEANRLALDEIDADNRIHPSAQLINCSVEGPVSIAENCILKGCQIGPYVSVGPGAVLEDCTVKNSIVLQDAYVKRSAELKDIVVGIGTALLGMHGKEGERK